MLSLREKILQFLETYQPASIHEIGKALQASDPNILYHLRILLQESVVELAPGASLRVHTRGRPEKFYRLKEAKQAENYARLSIALLDHIFKGRSTEEKISAGTAIASALLPTTSQGTPVHSKLSRLIDHFAENKYSARWEAHRDGPQIIFFNCPYLNAASTHPELCEIDRSAIELYLEAPVTIHQTFLEKEKPARQCRFQVKAR